MSEIHSSIPGETPFDTFGLLDPDIKTKKDLDEAEANSILLAYGKHLRGHLKGEWFHQSYIKRVHQDMFAGIWSWAGNYRDKNFEPTIGIPFHQIAIQIEGLCRNVPYWAQSKETPIPILEQAVRIHHRLVQIHPFRNGNGRHARLMSNIFLRSHSHALPLWPNKEMLEEGSPRTDYLAALLDADRGHYEPLMRYTRRFLA